MAVENKRMWQRGALEADLLAADEVPADREMIVASDTGRVWPGDGVSPLSARPFLVTADPMTGQMPDDVRETIAANLTDPSTPEGAALSTLLPSGSPTEASLRKFRSHLGAASTGQGVAKVLCIGDSITAGTGSFQSTASGSFPARLAARLEASGTPSGGTGRVWPAHNVTSPAVGESRWSLAGGFAPYEAGSSMLIGAAAAGATATFTADDPGEVVDIYFTANSGPFTYSIDGGAPVAVTSSGGNQWSGTTVTGLGNTNHTVAIKTTSSTFVGIGAVGTRRSVGVLVENAGNGGALSSSWIETAQWYQNGPTIAVCSPDASLTIIESMMVNDAQNGVTPQTHQANLQTIIGKWKTRGDVLLWVPPTSATSLVPADRFQSLRAVVYAAATATGVPVIDISQRWGDWDSANALGYMSDAAHPTSSGYDDIARAFAAVLLG